MGHDYPLQLCINNYTWLALAAFSLYDRRIALVKFRRVETGI